jgi:hypothetical protein
MIDMRWLNGVVQDPEKQLDNKLSIKQFLIKFESNFANFSMLTFTDDSNEDLLVAEKGLC